MLHRHHHHSHSFKDAGQRKVSPPGPSYMSDNQIASYLKDLRTNRPVRPSGSRPLPSKSSAGSTTTAQGNEDENLPPRASSAMSSYIEPAAEKESPPRATSAMSNFRMSYGSSAGRPLAQEPRSVSIRKNVSPPSVSSRTVPVSPNTAYRESGQRRMEKEEARSLRDALEEMDHDETRIHQAAQDEASELVWLHQNPGVPYKNPPSAFRNPDLEKPRQGSVGHSPSQSRGFRRSFMSSQRRDSRQSTSDTSSERQHTANSEDPSKRRSLLESPTSDGATSKKLGSFRKNLKVNFALPADESPAKTPISEDETEKTGSEEPSKGIFRNPQDQIYEEPKGSQPDTVNERPDFSRSDSSALRTRPRNAQPRGSRPFPGRLTNLPFVDKLARFDLNRSSSTQSRNPDYKTNDDDTVAEPAVDAKAPNEEAVPTKDGIEIRSDEIRAATSKKRTDRSSNLPMPTAVSDKTGRPIVSFDPSWKPTEAESPRKRDSMKDRESITPTPPREQPPAPTIEVSEAPPIPVINLPDTKEPTISEMDAGAVKAPEEGRRPLPEPTKVNGQGSNASSRRKLPTVSENRWYSPYTRAGVPAAKCESCTLPISGKIVTASGSRFHPECFVCHHCQTALECVGFYQEPEEKRNERLAEAPEDDEEARVVRFFCHLDFHELFSPRCKSCKTPIEGEVVVACGSEWHVGHFFCAECGDPFDSQTPFVEKDGFAWCLHCYSRRTAPKCMGCKKPVQEDVVITAIGGQWHDECFKCHECGHGFGPDGQFFVREGEPKRTAKGRIIGGPVQLAICEGCESIRLKVASFKR